MARYNHICGLYYVVGKRPRPERQYLPQLSLSVHTKIISSTSRTTLTQNFVNPKSDAIPELRYTFPLYDGVSVVGFVCTINGDRVIRGVVKERAEAKQTYQAAVDRGETAGLLEQLPDASDVFTTTIGNIPANATLKVEITYLGELKHDAEVDGIRFTIPTHIAPRYGSYPGQLLRSSTVSTEGGISIVVDVEMPSGSNVKNVQSPSHPISVTLGNTSAGAASGADMSLQKASATLALSTAELGDDFVLQVVATNTANPVAVLETHPTLPNHRALMATLVPKFNLPSSRPEIVFLCDRSGSMGDGRKIPNLKTALHLFLKSMPVGVKFNICSFGSHHEFLFPTGSRTYDASALEEATRYVDRFSANFGGTDIYQPMEDVFKKRYTDMDLEVFLLTDGEIWDQAALFRLLNKDVAESKGRIRVFSLGIGSDVSHALIEGVANAGNGFSQSVGDNENMNSKVVRMLKASLTPHIKDYTLEVKYHKEPAANSDDEFEIVEKVMDALAIDARQIERKEEAPKKPISLFDESANPDVEMTDASRDTSAGGKYSHLPSVPEPHFLQAPFNIPPLFSFSRTTVYLLLSPETVQKQPKSVILRGTSPYGPVELEIPVTVLATKDETIHQLAARKAVKELEEGRGWIYHAKNAKGDAGSLLKDLYPGRFDDMVEREAVRLGVTYQVGGKWCSFVAVEGNQETEDKARNMVAESSDDESEEMGFSLGLDSDMPIQPQAMSCSAAPNASSRGLFGIGPTRSVARSAGAPPPPLPSFAPRMATTSLSAVAPPPPPPGGASSHRKRSVIGGGAPSGGAPSGGLFTRGSMTKKPARKPRRNVPLGVCAVEESITDDELAPPVDTNVYPQHALYGRGVPMMAQMAGMAPGAGSFASPPPPPPAPLSPSSSRAPAAAAGLDANASPGEKLDLLVGMQSFSGAWQWDEGLLVLLGLWRRGFVAPEEFGGASDRFATALVLAFLEVVLAEKEDEWEMLADKALAWLVVELGDEAAVEVYREKAKEFLKKEAGLV